MDKIIKMEILRPKKVYCYDFLMIDIIDLKSRGSPGPDIWVEALGAI